MTRIVFDLDGTLIDSAPDINGIANALLAEEGFEPITLAQTRSFIGNGSRVFVQRMRDARAIPESEHERLHESFVARYDTAVHLTEIYPGVVAALTALRAQGFALGICTNKPIRACHAVMDHLELSQYFSTFWGGDSLPVHKPDPAPLHAAFDALGQAGHEGPCLYVGDSETDAQTAQRAGLPFLLYTEGYRKSPLSALPHAAAFTHYADFPALVSAQLEALA
ncbi:MAG: phosphoglycolate phosphatase [Neomegalonema sp.]|nr:phosphoglycolate phosphatase [Neomegalonema sp.]